MQAAAPHPTPGNRLMPFSPRRPGSQRRCRRAAHRGVRHGRHLGTAVQNLFAGEPVKENPQKPVRPLSRCGRSAVSNRQFRGARVLTQQSLPSRQESEGHAFHAHRTSIRTPLFSGAPTMVSVFLGLTTRGSPGPAVSTALGGLRVSRIGWGFRFSTGTLPPHL